jgi:hypothetical protein
VSQSSGTLTWPIHSFVTWPIGANCGVIGLARLEIAGLRLASTHECIARIILFSHRFVGRHEQQQQQQQQQAGLLGGILFQRWCLFGLVVAKDLENCRRQGQSAGGASAWFGQPSRHGRRVAQGIGTRSNRRRC